MQSMIIVGIPNIGTKLESITEMATCYYRLQSPLTVIELYGVIIEHDNYRWWTLEFLTAQSGAETTSCTADLDCGEVIHLLMTSRSAYMPHKERCNNGVEITSIRGVILLRGAGHCSGSALSLDNNHNNNSEIKAPTKSGQILSHEPFSDNDSTVIFW